MKNPFSFLLGIVNKRKEVKTPRRFASEIREDQIEQRRRKTGRHFVRHETATKRLR